MQILDPNTVECPPLWPLQNSNPPFQPQNSNNYLFIHHIIEMPTFVPLEGNGASRK